MMAAAALLFKAIGVAFLIAAALGVVRFADALQRMHASTKAGTVGAGFVLIGVALDMWSWDVSLMSAATILFLLLTVPIAGHLLGRAAYISGASLEGLTGDDPLRGVLPRSPINIDERLEEERQDTSIHSRTRRR